MTQAIDRKIIISQPITDGLAGAVIDAIIAVNDYDTYLKSNVVNYKPEPIEIFINSGGGSATAGNSIIMAMEMSETPIVTYGMGMVGSMALAIYVAGDIRVAHRFTRFMYHSVAYGLDGHIKDHEDALREANILQDMYNSLFLDRTKLTPEQMTEIRNIKRDFFISGKKAVKLGIAHELLEKPEKGIETISEEEYLELIKEIEKQAQGLK